MEQLIILQGITADQLLSRIEAIIEKKVCDRLNELIPKKPPKFITRNEVIDMLHITLPTLHDWTKTGILKCYRIGTRVLYKIEEIEDVLTKPKRFR